MNAGLILKKLDKNIDNCKKNEKVSLNIELLIGFVIDKINRSGSDETIINELESILLKLLNSGFNSTIQTFCYYLISNFYQEFNEQFFVSMCPFISNGIEKLEKFEVNMNSFRNFSILNEKDIMNNTQNIENILKDKNCDINYIINCFYFSNFPSLLLNIIKKISNDEIRQYKNFLSKLFLELGKLLLFNKLQDVAFLNLLQILSKLLSNFTCYEYSSENFEKIKIVNSTLIPMAEYLISHLDEIIFLIKAFEHKLLSQIILFPFKFI